MPLIAIGAGLIGSSIAKSVIGANSANKAASAQANAANYAANLQHQDAQQALAFQKQQYSDQQRILQPWINTGQQANLSLAYLMGLKPNSTSAYQAPAPVASQAARDAIVGAPNSASAIQYATQADANVSPDAATTQQWGAQGIPLEYIPDGFGGTLARRTDNDPNQSEAAQHILTPNTNAALGDDYSAVGTPGELAQNWTEQFVAPTDVTEQNDPGYQFRLQQGQQALERSAAAKGNVLSGGTLKDLAQFGQDYASNEYNNVYNRAFNEFSNRYNIFQNNQANKFNRLSALSGGGQVTAGQLGTLGQSAANNVGNILNTSGAQIGNDIQNAAAARASGYLGSGAAIGSGIGDVTSNLLSLYLNRKRLQAGNG